MGVEVRDTGSRIRPLEAFRALLAEGEEAFKKVIAFPVLLCASTAFKREGETDVTGPVAKRGQSEVHLVLEVRSRQDKRAVTFGRSDSADIVVAESSVSREHARFDPVQGGGWRLVDLDSRNGTRIGPIDLVPGKPEVVPDWAQIQFGNVQVYFLTPASFMRFLRQPTAEGPTAVDERR